MPAAASPGLDVGTSVPAAAPDRGHQEPGREDTAADGGVLNPGDTVNYNITIKNTGSVVVDNVYVYDTVPANTTYVGRHHANGIRWAADPWTDIPDDGGGTRSRWTWRAASCWAT